MLKPLGEISFPDLINFDRQSNVDEILSLIRSHPDWNTIYDGDLYQNASQMIIQLFSFLFEKNASAFNRQLREVFLNRAISPRAIFDNLKQLKINVKQNTESACEVIGVIQNAMLIDPLVIPRSTILNATAPNGTKLTFEIIGKDEEGNYDYINNIVVYPGHSQRDSFKMDVFSGQTFVIEQPVTYSTLENFKISITYNDIIENSIQIFYRQISGGLIKLNETDTFVIGSKIVPGIFPNGAPYFITFFNNNGAAEIYFGSAEFGGAFEEQHVGGTLVIYGRYGGGQQSNVNIGMIKGLVELVSGVSAVSVNFTNTTPASGGKDRENAYIAQIYGPMRAGRGKPIITDIDAQIALQKMVVKHEVESPKFSEIANNVPILHSYNRIVPIRDQNAFSIPEYVVGDTLSQYITKFITSLNIFFNVDGNNDGEINNEFASMFISYGDGGGTYNFIGKLDKLNPLSGTLKATAYNYNDISIDQIHWNGNYVSLKNIIAAISSDHAVVKTNSFQFLAIYTGINDKIKFSMDVDENGDDITYIFNIPLTSTLNRTPQDIANEIQLTMIGFITNPISDAYKYFAQYGNFQYVYTEVDPIDSSKYSIVIKSPRTGKNSKIKILSHGNTGTPDLYTTLGLTIKTYYPLSETERVFKQGSIYHHLTGEVDFQIDETIFDIVDRKYSDNISSPQWIQNNAIQEGPLVEIDLTEIEDPLTQEKIQLNSTIGITARYNNNEKDYIEFSAIHNSDTNIARKTTRSVAPKIPNYYGVFKDSADGNFNYNNSKITLRLNDGIVTTIYKQSFYTLYSIKLYKIIEITPGVWADDPGFTPITFSEVSGNWTQDRFNQTGPVIKLKMTSILSDGDYEIRVNKNSGGVESIIATMKFYDILGDTIIYGSEYQYFPGPPAPDPKSDIVGVKSGHYYDPSPIATTEDPDTNPRITIYCKDGEVDSSITYYKNGFDQFNELWITYKRKSYEYITFSYKLNPYKTTGEAKNFIDILMGKAKRLIPIQNIIKTINFLPIGIRCVLSIDKNYSSPAAEIAATNVLKTHFSYDNLNYEHTVGKRISAILLQAIIATHATTYGIFDMTFEGTDFYDSLKDDILKSTYFFILDDSITDQLKTLETEYPVELAGLAKMFTTQVIGVRNFEV